jgi:hypothetical protein
MKQRPISLTIIAWLILFFSLVYIVTLANFFLKAPSSPSLHASSLSHALMFVFAVNILFFIAAIGLLKGVESARWLCVVALLLYVSCLIAVGGVQVHLLIPFLVCCGIIVVLFLPKANQFFKAHKDKNKEKVEK